MTRLFMRTPLIFSHELLKAKRQFKAWMRQWKSSQNMMAAYSLPGQAVSGIVRCVSVSLGRALKLGELGQI